jgi:hypothetical protein
VSAAIVVMLALVGVGIVINELSRLRKWLKKPPPRREDEEPPDTGT